MPSGRVVGVNHARYLSPEEAWFEGIRVHADFRRAGIGRLLTVAAIEGARKRGVQVCRAAIDADNLPSQTLSRNFGFEPVVPIVQFEAPLDQITWMGPIVACVSHGSDLTLRTATAGDAPAIFSAVSKEMAYVGSDYTWWRVTPQNVARVIAQREVRLAVDAAGKVVAGAALSDPFYDKDSQHPVAYGEMSSAFGDWAGVMAIAKEYAAKASRLGAEMKASAKLCITCEARSPITEVLPRHGFTERFLEGRRDEAWLWELLLDAEAIVK